MVSQIWRTKATTDVLPLVPVTPTTVSGWRGWNRAAMSARLRLTFCSRRTGNAVSSILTSGPASRAAAPRARASGMNLPPSLASPRMAANRKPGSTARLSAVSPRISISPHLSGRSPP
jgi:hypothetical protein